MAFPPIASISRPAAAARGWLAATIPRDATASCFSGVNRLPVLSRHALPMPFSSLHDRSQRAFIAYKVTVYYTCDATLEPLDKHNRRGAYAALSRGHAILTPL